MHRLNFTIDINSSAAKAWQVLWSDSTYRQWTSVFHAGSYAVSDWKEGSKIQFLSPDGGGMYSVIDQCRPKEYIAFKHIGEVKNFEEQPLDDKTKEWTGGLETYTLNEKNGTTTLDVNVELVDQFLDYFKETFPKAIAVVKELAEKPIVITVETTVSGTIEKIWEHWTQPEHIKQWCAASDDWHTTKAENDIQTDGKFLSRMEAKDGSFGFDFRGTYSSVMPFKNIEYTMEDGRKAKINFVKLDGGFKIIESFEAEEENTIELQNGGWQAILDNFKKYTESK